MPMEDRDYFVHVLHFGVPIPAFIRKNPEDDTYSLYLNADYDFEHWLNSYDHEVMHMANDDLYGEKSITEIETQLKRGA